MSLQKVDVTICGKSYTLQTKEKPSYYIDLAEMIDKKISELMEQNKSLSMASASVLVSLSLLEENMKISRDVDIILSDYNYLKEKMNSQ